MKILDKPLVTKKINKFYLAIKNNGMKIGTVPRVIDFCYMNICNFKCEHCFTNAPVNPTKFSDTMPLSKVRDVADQAHELGIYEFDLQGGELLLYPERFFSLVEAIGPERFYVYLTTNGYFLTEDIAKKMYDAKIDRVSVSIDSINPSIHDSFRGCKGAHSRALKALKNVQNAGIAPFLNCTVGHYNAQSSELEELLQYSYDQGYTTILNVAAPAGAWEGNDDVTVDEKDLEAIQKLREKFPNITRDKWDPFDRKERKNIIGCNCVNLIYMTPFGDILPCPFVHIKLGNVYEQSLKEIVEYGFSIKYFSEYQEKCLAAENKKFINEFLSKPKSIYQPLIAEDIFIKDDYI